MFRICVDVYKIYEGGFYDEIYKILSTLKKRKLKINIILIEKGKHTNENPDFEQQYYSRTAISVHKMGHDTVRLTKWLA